MEKLYKILEDCVIYGNNSFDLVNDYKITQDVLSAMKKVKEQKEEKEEKAIEPKLVGYLNRKIGYNNYKPLDIGTPVYYLNGSYIMYHEPKNGGEFVKILFSEISLINYINLNKDE